MPRKVIGIAAIIVWLLPLGGAAQHGRTRTFEFTYVAEVRDIPSGARTVSIWLPYPPSDENQRISDVRIHAPAPWRLTRDPEYGNQILYIRVGERPAREIGEDEEPIASGNKEISPRIVIPLRHERSHRVPRGRDRKRRHLVHHAVPHASDVPPTLSFPHDDQINRHTKDRPIQQTERWPTPRRQDQNGGHNGQRDRPRISKSTPTIAQENERARLDTIGEDDVHMPVAIQIARLELSGHRRHGERTRAHPIRNRLELQDAAR